MAELDTNLTDSQLVMAAHQFLADLTNQMQGVASFLTPEEEEQVKSAYADSQRCRQMPTTETRDAVPWEATTKAPDDTPWDWPAADKALRAWSGVDADSPPASAWSKYEQAFAWFDQTNPQVLSSYKLPHHTIIDGKLCVVIKGVFAAMAALNGARGGTTIPTKDQDAVYQHLRKHYHQFGATPPDQSARSANPQIERRSAATFELGDGNTHVGRAAAFNSWTTINTRNGNFEESIKPGAFSNIANCNVYALVNHDPSQLLGSTKSGNVRLKQTPQGLDFEIKLLPTTLSKDIRTLVKNKVIAGCSFGFDGSTTTDEWDGNKRTLLDVPDVVDISLVTYPAYQDVTSVDVRSKIAEATPKDLWRFALALKRMNFFQE